MAGDNLGAFFVVAAYALIVGCKFLLIFEMFKVSILWGAAGIFLAPISTLIFMANYWERAKGKFYTALAALLYCVIMIVGVGQLTKPTNVQKTTNPSSAPVARNPDPASAPKSNFLPAAKNESGKKLTGQR